MQLFLLLLLLLSCVSMEATVAGCLTDRDKDDRPRENCTAAGFSDIPVGIEPTTKVLLFPRNLFSSLSWSSFQVFAEIYEIDLTGNKVPAVTPSASPILPTLSVLRLGSNRLTSLPDGSFSACPYLTELYLENNAISSLRDHTFSGLTKLEILDLTSNHIRVLPGLMLHPLPAIETLYLEINKISVMPDNWFSQKEEVPYLYLSGNPWACSCSLSYLRRYLDDYELNVYVRDGPDIKGDVESVVCDSPQQHKGIPVINLEESDLCSQLGPTGDFDQPATKYTYHMTTAVPVPVPATTYYPPSSRALAQFYTMYDRVSTWSWSKASTSLTEWSDYSHTEVASVRFHEFLTRPTISPVGSWTQSQPAPAKTTTSVPLTTTSPTPTLHAVTTTEPTTNYKAVTTTEATTNYKAVTTTEPTTNYKAVTRTEPTTNYKAVTTTEPTTNYKAVTTVEATTTFDAVTTMRAATIMSSPVASDVQRHEKVRPVRPAGVFCIWLFAGCLLLCMALAACILATVTNMVIWYRRMYKPLCVMLARRRGAREGVMLLMYNRAEGKEVGSEGVMALYRSVLFVHREAGEGMERENGGETVEGEGRETLLVTLKPAGEGVTREEEGERRGREERGVYKKTLYRVLSREEEIEGWRDVMEECRVSKEDGSGRGDGQHWGMDRLRSTGGEGVSKKRYSVILREEREEMGGGKEELDWVVGGWEVKREGAETGEEPRSSWGEWLAHYLPSMPWGVSAPSEDEAAL